MFFVDNDKTESLEIDILWQDFVGADDDIDRPIANAIDRTANLFRWTKARQLYNFDGPVGETIGKRLRVLFGEQSGGAQ